MKSGFKIQWTLNARKELERTIDYLQANFSDKEIRKLVQKTESVTQLLSQNPNLYPKTERHQIHKVSILKFNTLYYRIKDDRVEILSFFSNRQSPDKRKLS